MNSSMCGVLFSGRRLVALATVFFVVAFVTNAHADLPKEGPAVQALRHMVASHPEFKQLLVASIEHAHQVNPDPVTNPVQTLEQYFNLIAFTERAQPGRMVVPTPASTLRGSARGPRDSRTRVAGRIHQMGRKARALCV